MRTLQDSACLSTWLPRICVKVLSQDAYAPLPHIGSPTPSHHEAQPSLPAALTNVNVQFTSQGGRLRAMKTPNPRPQRARPPYRARAASASKALHSRRSEARWASRIPFRRSPRQPPRGAQSRLRLGARSPRARAQQTATDHAVRQSAATRTAGRDVPGSR